MEATSAGAGRVALRVQGGDRLTDAAQLPIVVETPVAMETAALTGVVPLRPGAPAARVDEAL